MKFVALVSGGKDSCFNVLHCLKLGHELVALANLHPIDASDQELDSFMFQTVGHDIVSWYGKCTGLPLFRQPISRDGSKNVELNYAHTENDEVEDLFQLLSHVKSQIPDLGGVSVGAILSSYQRTRVEDVCARLNLVPLSYLWQRDQLELMEEMCSMSKQEFNDDAGKMDARIIKVAAIGLDQKSLNKSLPQMLPKLRELNEKYDVHICGEGGEFETLVVDAPFFFKGSLEVISHIPILTNSNDGVFSTRLDVKFDEIDRSLDLKAHLERIPIPPVLNDKWMDLLQQVKEQKTSNNKDVSSSYQSFEMPSASTKISMVQLNNILFISNIQARKDLTSVQEQGNDVFLQLKSILKSKDISPSRGLCCSLLLSDISNFAEINKLYSKFFSIDKYGPLPPARACVGSNSLDSGCLLQLSVVFDASQHPSESEELGMANKKSGLHVQGRSYWAPCNIGPYSQAIWSLGDPNKISHISGQIALNPATMDMLEADPELQAVAALRHFDTLKTTIDATQQLHVTCFIVEDEMSVSISNLWSLYCSECSENMLDAETDFVKCLIVVKVSQLPRQALCEWSGITCRETRHVDNNFYDDQIEEGLNKDLDPISAGGSRGPPKFNDIVVKNIHGDRHFITGFEDNIDDLLLTLGTFSKKFKSTLYYNPISLRQRPNFFDDLTNIEFYPVEGVYDHAGTLHSFGYHVIA